MIGRRSRVSCQSRDDKPGLQMESCKRSAARSNDGDSVQMLGTELRPLRRPYHLDDVHGRHAVGYRRSLSPDHVGLIRLKPHVMIAFTAILEGQN